MSAAFLFTMTNDMSDTLYAAGRLKALFNTKIKIENQEMGSSEMKEVRGSIYFRDIVFQYPNTDHIVLKSINLRIKAGEHIAIVGPSGSRKSSIIALLEHFYNHTSGTILVDGQDISQIQLKKYRSFLALVSQDITLYEGSLRENIALDVDDGAVSEDDIQKAIEIADLIDFIASLPDGLSTRLGTSGCMLSRGQKQRVSLARAVLRNPRILLLDEATSALDAASEAAVQKTLDKAFVGRTTITVTHRLNTVRGADRIYLLENGSFVEQGTHDELMTLEGRYFGFVKLQEMHER